MCMYTCRNTNNLCTHRVVKCDVIILQTFPFKPQNHIMRYTQLLKERVQNFKSLALLKAKIEKFKVRQITETERKQFSQLEAKVNLRLVLLSNQQCEYTPSLA